jgi:hypothetical protein
MKSLPFIIFENDEEKSVFMERLKQNLDEFFSDHPGFPRKRLGEEMLQEEQEFAEWAYRKWQSG